MYCLPFTLFEIGAEFGTSFNRTSHSAFPFVSSYAVNQRSSAPANTRPPAAADILGQLSRVVPEFVSRRGIEGLNIVVIAMNEDDAVVNKRRPLIWAWWQR